MYSIKFLDNEEFNKLPFKDAEWSLGMANPKTGEAFIRSTALKDLQDYLVNHEFDELVASESSHEDPETGIRYKNFKSTLGGLAPIAGGLVGSMFGPLGVGIGTGLGSTGGGLLQGKGFGESLKQGAISGVTSGLGAKFLPGVTDKIGGGVSSVFSKIPVVGSLFNKGATSASGLTDMVGSFAPSLNGAGSFSTQGMSSFMPSNAINSVLQSSAPQQSSLFGGLTSGLKNLGKNALSMFGQNIPAATSPTSVGMMTGANNNMFSNLLSSGTAFADTGAKQGGGGMSWLNNLFGGAGKALNSAYQNTKSGASNVLSKIFGSNTPSSIAGQASGFPQSFSSTITGAQNSMSNSPFGTLLGQKTGAIPGMSSVLENFAPGGPSGSTSTNAGSSLLSKLFGGAKGQASGEGLRGLMKNPLTGAALIGGSMFYPKVPTQIPTSQNFESLASTMNAGGGPMSQLAQQKLTGLMGQDMQALTDEEAAAITRDYDMAEEKEIAALQDLYRNVRPGSDPTTDSTFRRDLQEIKDKYARAKSDTLSGARRNIYNDYQNQQLANIAQAQGIDLSNNQVRSALAQMDIAQIAEQFAVDYGTASDLKDYIRGMGTELLSNAINPEPTAQEVLELMRGVQGNG